MSRSRKKNPIGKDHNSGKWGKKQANRTIRRNKYDLYKKGAYKKAYPQWDIHDYISFYSKEQAIQDWYAEESDADKYKFLHKKYQTLEKWLLAWEKMMLRK